MNWFRDKSGAIWCDVPYSEAVRIPPPNDKATQLGRIVHGAPCGALLHLTNGVNE